MAWPVGIDPGIDPGVPSPARIYDYCLGGKDNFAADREAAEKALSLVPQGREVARSNRRFLIRAVRYMASHGVAQFIEVFSPRSIRTSGRLWHETGMIR
jgi:hypothetical protein